MRFKTFLSEQNIGDTKTSENKSIPHLDDLDIETFIRSIENINKMKVTDKLDGTALRFGLDLQSNFYTTRAGKGSPKKIYNINDYPDNGAGNIFSLGHKVLLSQIDIIRKILEPGEAIDIEILYGVQPNAIIYGADNKNFIGFLDSVQGDSSKQIDNMKPILLGIALENSHPNIQHNMLESLDGLTIIKQPVISEWSFVVPRTIDSSELEIIDLSEILNKLKAYLNLPNDVSKKSGYDFTNRDILQVSTKNIDKPNKDIMKVEKQLVQDTIDVNYKSVIKSKILDQFIRNYTSPLQSKVHAKDSIGLEGLVFTDQETGFKFKVVDKELFTQVNKFNYMIRRKIRGNIMTINQDSPLEARGGLYGNAIIRIMQLFNIDSLVLPRNVKKFLIKYKGKTGYETVSNIADTLIQNNFDGMKRKSIAVIDFTVQELEDGLEDFKHSKNSYTINLSNGKTIKYSPTIIKRTLLTFAEARRDLLNLREKITKANDIKDFIIIMLGNKIKQIHGV